MNFSIDTDKMRSEAANIGTIGASVGNLAAKLEKIVDSTGIQTGSYMTVKAVLVSKKQAVSSLGSLLSDYGDALLQVVGKYEEAENHILQRPVIEEQTEGASKEKSVIGGPFVEGEVSWKEGSFQKGTPEGSFIHAGVEGEGKLGDASGKVSVEVNFKNKTDKNKGGDNDKKKDIGADVYAKGEVHAATGSTDAFFGLGPVNLLKLEGEGSVLNGEAKGEAGVNLYKDGQFTPQVYAKGKAGVNVAEGSVEGTLGPDYLNGHAKAEGKVLTASGEASFEAGKLYDEETGETSYGAKGKIGGEAYLATGEISGGFNFLGINVETYVEGKAGGAGASAGGEVSDKAVEGEISAGLIFGAGVKIRVDWSDFKWPFWEE